MLGISPPGSYEDAFNELSNIGKKREASVTASNAVNITEDNWLKVLTDKANAGDQASLDKLIDYLGTVAIEKSSRDWKAQREDTAYQRLVSDLKKAGLSPYIISGATPFAASANSHTLSGSQYTSTDMSKRTSETARKDRELQLMKTIFSLVGTAVAALAFLA